MADDDRNASASRPEHADAHGSPPTSLSQRLIDRPSWPGAIVVAVLALGLIAGVPALSAAMHGGGYPVGEPFEGAPGLQVTVGEGWEYDDSSGLFYILSKDGAQMILVPAVAADASLEEGLQPTLDGLATAGYLATEPQSFTTDAGADGIVVTGHSDTDMQITWLIQSDGGQATFLLTGPDAAFDTLFAEADAIVRSAVILEVIE